MLTRLLFSEQRAAPLVVFFAGRWPESSVTRMAIMSNSDCWVEREVFDCVPDILKRGMVACHAPWPYFFDSGSKGEHASLSNLRREA
jgi:hypothetical protein